MQISSFQQLISHPDVDWAQIKLVSFDFFDTLVWRKQPEISLLQDCLRDFAKQHHLTVTFDDFMHWREQSYAELGEQNQTGESDRELSIYPWYANVFANFTDDPGLAEAFCQQLLAAEAANLVVRSDVKQTLQALQKRGISTVITSDTYYPEVLFHQVLQANDLAELTGALLLSCELGVNKASGKLFARLLAQHGVAAKQVVHVGDNLHSDVQQAARAGIQAVHFVDNGAQQQQQALLDFGQRIIAPLLVAFSHWLAQHSEPASRLVFLARDGFLLHRAFQLLYPQRRSDYLYLNRVIANQLSFTKLDSATLAMLNHQHKAEGVWGLVKVFGLYQTDFAEQLQRFVAQQQLSQDSLLNDALCAQLLRDQTLVEQFAAALADKQPINRQYLQQCLQDQQAILVDVGWRGSIFKQLAPLFASIKECRLFASVQADEQAIQSAVNPQRQSNYLVNLSEYRDLLEWAVSENIGACVGINRQLQAEFADKQSDQAKLTVQKGIQQGLLAALNQPQDCALTLTDALDNWQTYLSTPPAAFLAALRPLQTEMGIDGQSATGFADLLGAANVNSVTSCQQSLHTQGRISSFLALVTELKQASQLVIYGAGSGFEFVYPHLAGEIDFIVDINRNLQGKCVHGIEVHSPEALQGVSGTLLISVIGRKQQITPLLQNVCCSVLFLEDYM